MGRSINVGRTGTLIMGISASLQSLHPLLSSLTSISSPLFTPVPECRKMLPVRLQQSIPPVVNMKLIALSAALCLALVGFSPLARSEDPMTPPAFTDPSQPIEVQAGQEFVISLESNATTGYGWKCSGIAPEGVVELQGNEYRAPQVQRKGAGGIEEWRFRALKAGEATITLHYLRPWEKDKQPERTAEFKVRVRGTVSMGSQ
jgi:inhibitor of cysteine peptidase